MLWNLDMEFQIFVHLTLPDERASKLSKLVVAINSGLKALLYFKNLKLLSRQ